MCWRCAARTIGLLIGIVGGSATMAAEEGALRGTVRLAVTGDPVAAAVVRLVEIDRRATTDAAGAFVIAGVPPGTYTVVVEHEALSGTTGRVTLAGAQATHLALELHGPAIRQRVTVVGVDVRDLLPEGIEGAPGAASTLTARDIERLRPYTLHDALAFLPGVRAIDDDALGRRSGIGLRGAPARRSRQVLLLEDGVPINAATYLDPSAHYTPPLERLERVDVLKGAGQIVHGPLNNHGIVNFHTVRPSVMPESVVDAGVGTQGTVRRHLLHRRTSGPVGVVVGYTGMNADGVFDTERHQYDDLFGSLEWRPHERHEVSGSLTYLRERSRYDERNLTLEEFAANPRGKRALGEGAELNTMAVDFSKAHLTHRATLAEGITAASHVFVTHLDRPRFESRRGGPRTADGYMGGRERRYTTLGAASRVEIATPRHGAVRHRWEGGLRWERQYFDNRETVGAVGEVLSESHRGTLAVADGATFFEDGRRETLDAWAVSGFVQDAFSAGRLTITPGLRVERYTQRRTLDFLPGASTPHAESDARTLLLPGISVLYEGLRASEVYMGLHRGYSPAIARTEDFPLVPETGIDAQIGARTRSVRGLTLEAAGFSSVVKNTIVKKTFTDERGLNIFLNSGDSRMRGLDVGGRLDSRAFSGSALNVFVHTVYSYARAVFIEAPIAGRRVPEVPLHAGSLTSGVEHPAWQGSVTLSHFGSFFTDEENTRPLSAPDPGEPLELVGLVPGHVLLSARASYRVATRPMTVWVQGRNLTNRLYISDVHDGLRPGAARTVSAGVRIVF